MIHSIQAIALTTYRESIRSKILYSVFFFTAILLVVSALFGSVTIGDRVQVIKTFGLFCVSLCSVMFCVISGSALFYKEIAHRTIFNILAKPVSRAEFILGKYLGLLYTASVLSVLMTVGVVAFVFCFEGAVQWSLFQASLYTILELAVVCACVMLFSTIVVTPILIGLFSFGIFLVGRSADYLLYFTSDKPTQTLFDAVLQGLYVIVPHLNDVQVNDLIVSGVNPGGVHLIGSLLYVCGYAAVLLLCAAVLFQRREFN